MPVQNWLQAQAVRGFVRFLSLHWPRLLQTEGLWIPSSAKKAGVPTDWRLTGHRTAFQHLHPPSAKLECTGGKFVLMLSWAGLCLGFWETTGLVCFDSASSPGGNLPKYPAVITFSTLLVCVSVFTVESFCVFRVCMCVYPPGTHIALFAFIRPSSCAVVVHKRKACVTFLKTKLPTLPSPGQTSLHAQRSTICLQSNPLRWVLLLTPFHRWRNWCLEMPCP